MPTDILMPALSPTMEQGKLAKWLKNEGDKVKPGDILAEIETDKATMEVEAIDEGVLAKILVSDGTDNVAVNTPIAILAGEGEDVSAAASKGPAQGGGEALQAPVHRLAEQGGLVLLQRQPKHLSVDRDRAAFEACGDTAAQALAEPHCQPPIGGLAELIRAAQSGRVMLAELAAAAEIGEQGLGHHHPPRPVHPDPIAVKRHVDAPLGTEIRMRLPCDVGEQAGA